jgi:hypothetical protein
MANVPHTATTRTAALGPFSAVPAKRAPLNTSTRTAVPSRSGIENPSRASATRPGPTSAKAGGLASRASDTDSSKPAAQSRSERWSELPSARWMSYLAFFFQKQFQYAKVSHSIRPAGSRASNVRIHLLRKLSSRQNSRHFLAAEVSHVDYSMALWTWGYNGARIPRAWTMTLY